MSDKLLMKASPNGHRSVCLIQSGDDENATYFVTDPQDEDGADLGGDYDAALKFFKDTVAEWEKIPNWEAQARYDEVHGTDNGYYPMPRREY